MRSRARGLAGITPYMDRSRHHVFGHAPADVAFNDDLRLLIHSRDKVAGVTGDFDV